MDASPDLIALAALAGVAAGILAGLFGVGGGIVFVPTFVFLFAFDQLDAQATSLAAIIPVALIGAWRQSGEGQVDWRAAALMGGGAAIGVLLGAEVAIRLDDEVLTRAFGAVLLLVGGEMLVRSVRRLKAARATPGPAADPRRP
jgi:uncharacterized membrane protein YfcA